MGYVNKKKLQKLFIIINYILVAFTPAHFRSQKKEFPGTLSIFALFYTEAGVFLAHAGDFLISNLGFFAD